MKSGGARTVLFELPARADSRRVDGGPGRLAFSEDSRAYSENVH